MILKTILKSLSPNIIVYIQQIIDIKIEQLYPGLSWSLVELRKYFKYDTAPRTTFFIHYRAIVSGPASSQHRHEAPARTNHRMSLLSHCVINNQKM